MSRGVFMMLSYKFVSGFRCLLRLVYVCVTWVPLGFLNKSGRKTLKYKSRAGGIPFHRHSETDAGSISQSLAVADVPPSSSMIFSANGSLFM